MMEVILLNGIMFYTIQKNKTPIDIVQDLYYIAHSHVGNNNYLYRIFLRL